MKILVFVSKSIGNELINVLFSQFNDETNRIFYKKALDDNNNYDM